MPNKNLNKSNKYWASRKTILAIRNHQKKNYKMKYLLVQIQTTRSNVLDLNQIKTKEIFNLRRDKTNK